MEDFNQKEIVNETVQTGQSELDNESKLTTEQFHKMLEDNTKQMNRERECFVQRKIEARRSYDSLIQSADHDLEELRAKRNKYNELIRETMADFEAKERNIMKFRREARENYERTLCDLKGQHANINERITMRRHNLFETYRKSGGAIYGRFNLVASPRMEQGSQTTK